MEGGPGPMSMPGMPVGMPNGCKAGRDRCDGACVDQQRNAQHCGRCNKRCNDKQACVAGKCEKADKKGEDARVAINDVAGLARILALFGWNLEDLARVKGVEVEDLAYTPITLTDLTLLGIDEATLGLLGLGIDTLALIGIEIALE